MQPSRWLVLVLAGLTLFAGCLGSPTDDERSPAEEPDDGTPEEGAEALAWSERAPVPTARTEVSTAILDDELYVIGGFEANDQPSTTVEVLDLTSDEWREAPALPVPLHHARAVNLEGAVHLFGGYNAIPFQATPTHLVLEPGAATWSQAQPLPVARGGHGAAVVNGSAYLVGGVGPDGELLAQVDVYDPEDDSFTQAPELPTPRDHLGVAASEGRLHAVGGREQTLDTNVGTHEVLAPGEAWVQAEAMGTARGGVDAANVDGSIVVAGGEAEEATFAEVEAWDPEGANWTAWPELPTPRHGLGVDGWEGELITTAGGPEPGLSVSDAVEVLAPADGGSAGADDGSA